MAEIPSTNALPDMSTVLAPATVEQSLARIALAFERIATAIEDGRASRPAPQAAEPIKPQPSR